MNIFVPVAIFVFSALVAIIATGALIPILRSRTFLDHPNTRSSHQEPTPKGAGLALVFTVVIIWFLIANDPLGLLRNLTNDFGITWVIGGACLLALVSLIDDLRGLNPLIRLVSHFLVVLGVLLYSPDLSSIFEQVAPKWIAMILVAFLWVWFINLFNFMDGIDGLAGIQTGAIGIGVFLISLLVEIDEPIGLFSVSIAAVGLGFLFWNWAPAKVFLGDAGSIPLGFLLGWLLVSLASKGFWVQALIIPAYYLADSTLTLALRGIRGKKLWEPHRSHFYQQAIKRGLGHARVCGVVAATNAILILISILSLWFEITGIIGTIVAVFLLLFYLKGQKST